MTQPRKKTETILVTGAAGGVGTHMVAQILEHTTMNVRAVDRMPFASSSLGQDEWFRAHRKRIEWVRSPLDRLTDFGALTKGCNAIIHVAAIVSLTEEFPHFVESNITVTQRLWDAAKQSKSVEHMVHLSCASLYKTDVAGLVLVESSEVEATNGYERSKLESEQVFTNDVDDAHDTLWTILRPALVYGPFCTTMSAGVVTLPSVLRGVTPYLPGLTGGPRNNWCHAQDVASAAMFVLGHPKECGDKVFNVGDDTPLGLGEVLTSITEAYKLPIGPLIPFPTKVAGGLISSVLKRDVVVNTTRSVLQEVWKTIQFDHEIRSPLRPRVDKKAMMYAAGDTLVSADALRQLGWEPLWTDFREGIAETILWYQAKGWLPSYDRQTLREVESSGERQGVSFGENLTGKLHHVTGGEQQVRMALKIAFDSVTQFWPRLDGNLDGTISVDGEVSEQPVEGTIHVVWRGQRVVVYDFGFRSDEGDAYRFHGEKALALLKPMHSLRTLTGEVVNDRGEVVGELTATFELSEQWIPLLLSVRALRQRVPRA